MAWWRRRWHSPWPYSSFLSHLNLGVTFVSTHHWCDASHTLTSLTSSRALHVMAMQTAAAGWQGAAAAGQQPTSDDGTAPRTCTPAALFIKARCAVNSLPSGTTEQPVPAEGKQRGLSCPNTALGFRILGVPAPPAARPTPSATPLV